LVHTLCTNYVPTQPRVWRSLSVEAHPLFVGAPLPPSGGSRAPKRPSRRMHGKPVVRHTTLRAWSQTAVPASDSHAAATHTTHGRRLHCTLGGSIGGGGCGEKEKCGNGTDLPVGCESHCSNQRVSEAGEGAGEPRARGLVLPPPRPRPRPRHFGNARGAALATCNDANAQWRRRPAEGYVARLLLAGVLAPAGWMEQGRTSHAACGTR